MAIYRYKIDKPTYVSDSSHFTSKANVSLTDDGYYALFLETNRVILDNNISIKKTRNNDESMSIAVWAAADGVTSITSNNSAKKINSVFNTATWDAISAYGIMGLSSVNLAGKKFLYSINVSASNIGNAEAFGINFNGITASANINKAITVSATASGGAASAQAIAISSAMSTEGDRNMTLNNGVSGAISATAVSKYDTALSCAFDSIELTILGNLSSKITSSASGNSRNNQVSAYGFYAQYIAIENFNANLTVTASNHSTSYASGIEDVATGILILGGKAGKINVSASSTNGDAMAYGINGSAVVFANFACSIQVAANSKNNDASAFGVVSDGNIVFYCDISKDITITAKNIRAVANYSTNACALMASGTISAYDISSKISAVSTNEGDAIAACVVAAQDVSFDEISGSITAKAVNKEHYGSGISQANIFTSDNGSFTATTISGKLTAEAVDGSASAYGIFTNTNISIGDMAKSKITLTAKSGNGNAEACAIYSKNGDMFVDPDGLNLGKITVTATGGKYFDSEAYGICLSNGAVSAESLDIGQKLSGNLTVKSNGTSVGIYANSIDITSSVNMTVSGKDEAYCYGLGYADSILRISESTVTAKVTDKYGAAYAVYAETGTSNQVVFITNKSTVTGNIDLSGGDDYVFIESGSKLKGALEGVEGVTLDISDSSNKNFSLWDIVDSAGYFTPTNLEIDFDYGMTGDFLICTKENSIAWRDAIQNGIDVSFDGGSTCYYDLFELDKRNNVYSDSFYTFELHTEGNKMILSVNEKIF